MNKIFKMLDEARGQHLSRQETKNAVDVMRQSIPAATTRFREVSQKLVQELDSEDFIMSAQHAEDAGLGYNFMERWLQTQQQILEQSLFPKGRTPSADELVVYNRLYRQPLAEGLSEVHQAMKRNPKAVNSGDMARLLRTSLASKQQQLGQWASELEITWPGVREEVLGAEQQSPQALAAVASSYTSGSKGFMETLRSAVDASALRQKAQAGLIPDHALPTTAELPGLLMNEREEDRIRLASNSRSDMKLAQGAIGQVMDELQKRCSTDMFKSMLEDAQANGTAERFLNQTLLSVKRGVADTLGEVNLNNGWQSDTRGHVVNEFVVKGMLADERSHADLVDDTLPAEAMVARFMHRVEQTLNKQATDRVNFLAEQHPMMANLAQARHGQTRTPDLSVERSIGKGFPPTFVNELTKVARHMEAEVGDRFEPTLGAIRNRSTINMDYVNQTLGGSEPEVRRTRSYTA